MSSQQPPYQPGGGQQAAYSLGNQPPTHPLQSEQPSLHGAVPEAPSHGQTTGPSGAYVQSVRDPASMPGQAPQAGLAQQPPDYNYPQQAQGYTQQDLKAHPSGQDTFSGPPAYTGPNEHPPEKSEGYGTSIPGQEPIAPGQAQAYPPPPVAPQSQQYMQAPFSTEAPEDDPSSLHYTRDPKRLTAYLVPFPHPKLKNSEASEMIPSRFLIYTPPPPPIGAPAEGDKEGRIHKVQRKWQNEVREAKTTQAKVTSWKGIKGRATKGIDWAMGQTKSSSLEFLNRIPGKTDEPADKHSDDGVQEGETVKKTVGLEELILFHPDSLQQTEEQIREQFVNTMLRTQSKAEKDAIIATGLIPVGLAIDLLLTVVWPFGGLAEIDTVWAVASIRGAKTARSVTKRINSSLPGGDSSASGGVQKVVSKLMSKIPGPDQSGTQEDHKLRLRFIPSPRIQVMSKYLATECHQKDRRLFESHGPAPTESDVLEAIGWEPSQIGGETKNWEDEQWELQEVKEDIRSVMRKGAREWDKWVKAYEEDPQKALKK